MEPAHQDAQICTVLYIEQSRLPSRFRSSVQYHQYASALLPHAPADVCVAVAGKVDTRSRTAIPYKDTHIDFIPTVKKLACSLQPISIFERRNARVKR